MVRLWPLYCTWIILAFTLVGTSAVFGQAASEPSESDLIAQIRAHYRSLGVPSPDPSELGRAFYPNRLNLPTMMTQIGGYWFIVDSYNNRVLYSDQPDQALDQWNLLDGELSRPHSIAGNGEFFLVDDTEAHSLRVYRDNGSGIERHQLILDAGARPHRVWYEPESSTFYSLAANSQELLVMRQQNDSLEILSRTQLPSIRGMYVRSFRVIDGKLWLFTAHGIVSVVDHLDPGFPEIARYTIPPELESLNDMIRVGGKGAPWYATATRNRLSQCRLVASGNRGGFQCRALHSQVGFRGNPYLFHLEGSRLYLGVIAGKDTILRMDLSPTGEISAVVDLFSG